MPETAPVVRFRDRSWKRFIEGPDPALREELYLPMLAAAVRYDRSCAYFSSSVLAAAARGFGRFIQALIEQGEKAPRPAIRLVVNEEMSAEDVRALTETSDLSKLEKLLLSRFRNPKDLLEKCRLQMLAWLVKQGLLEIRVGVMRSGGGIVHAKFGLATDADGESVVFSGSGNESAPGLLANYETLEVSTFSSDPERCQHYRREFDLLWCDQHATVHTVTLPEAVRLKLIKLAPKEPPLEEPSDAAARQKAAMIWRFMLEAPYLANGGPTCDATAPVDLWPHQKRVVEETAAAWPSGRLLCDEVGMGKTVEAILVLRRLLAGRGVRRVLILLPAGLLGQWQAELREKGGLVFPRLEGLNLMWPDGRTEKIEGLAEALRQDALLLSRETARLDTNLAALLAVEAWDLVVLDEAHAARRKEQDEGEFNVGNLLLTLLRELQLRRKARSILLLSATPMQTQPWEPWDLLAVLGEGGPWLADFGEVRNFYDAVALVRGGFCGLDQARKTAALIASDPEFPPPPLDAPGPLSAADIWELLAFVPRSQQPQYALWLRQGSPLGRRMHRNTRETLRRYHELALLATPPPQREVRDRVFDYTHPAEREVYEAVTEYIERRFAELEREKPGKGFVMTIYRRRASSSPQALERSLDRRRRALLQIAKQHAYDFDLEARDVPELLDLDELPEGQPGFRPSASLPQSPAVARAELVEVERLLENLQVLAGRDSKRDVFFGELRRLMDEGRAVLVFTEYVDTMEYLRDALKPHFGVAVGCYCGDGGQMFEGDAWKRMSKAEVTAALREGRLQILVCTDAASEGLNLQAAGALINYDLPWNPSKVEQRIGRIDRIGQKHETVKVLNLFLEHSVDEQVYRALRRRCGLFNHFVGAMQPVLARARRMLRGDEPVDTQVLDASAAEVEGDALATETYMTSEAVPASPVHGAYSRTNLESALALLETAAGLRVKREKASGAWIVSGSGQRRLRLTAEVTALERDPTLLPLTPLTPEFHALLAKLAKPGERLPLVVSSVQRGAFRRSVAYWVAAEGPVPISGLGDLEKRLDAWTGDAVSPEAWRKAEDQARHEAGVQVGRMEEEARKREETALRRQVEAASIRLLIELGRYLVCLGEGAADLKRVMYRHMSQDSASAARLKQCWERLGRYPEWPESLRQDLERFIDKLPEHRRKARLAGMEVDAALRDPRWAVATGVT